MLGVVERPDRIELPCDHARPALRTPSWQRASGRIPAGTSPDVVLAAYAVFVGKVASTRDFVIGRADGGLAVALEPAEPLTALAARLAQSAPLTALEASADPARHPLYDVGFGDGEPLGDLHLRVIGGDYALYYDAHLFSAERAQRLARAFERVVRATPGTPIGAIGLLSEAEASEQLVELCSPVFNWPQHFVLHELFEGRVDREPDATAVVFGDQRVSYRELEARANALAHRLIAVDVGPDAIVALIQDRSVEMIVAILGVLKAGGAYLPIEPDAPADRVRYLLDDSAAAAVVTTSAYAARIAHRHVIAVDAASTGDTRRPEPRADPHNLAYVIYTSGSTGQPKGVLVEHRNVVHFIFAEKQDFAIRASDAVIQTSSYTFDASIDQIWLALTSGAKLVLVAKQTLLDPTELARLVEREQVTHLDSVPALLAELPPLPSVRQVVVGGETCPVPIARAWSKTARFWNEYGPTETTVGSLRYLVDPALDLGTRVPIGRPIGMTRVYVLDWGGCPVPIGVRGELCIGGAGVARGYLGRDELTRQKFVADPFAKRRDEDVRMYRTGDVVAWLPDGGLEFFGRIDSQVKVRGFRIELGEIESALQKYDGVSGAAVTVFGGDRLVCHFTAERALDAGELRAHLAQSLPAYMVPDFFVQLDAFPLTVSGKIDRKALPPPELDHGAIEPPANQIEEVVRDIWALVLRLDAGRIGVTRSFFELGGHSLLVMQMLARIRERLGAVLSAPSVLARPTIRAIAAAIAGKEAQAALPRAPAGSTRAATSVQRRMYVIHQGAPFNTADNLPLLYAIDGELDEDAIAAACAALLERHESLRTAFFFHEGEIVQKIAQAPHFELERHVLLPDERESAAAAFVRPFQLDAPPLFRAAVFVEPATDRVTHLALDMHHIVSDGISIDVLLEELLALARGESLPPTSARYFDYSAWLDTDDARERLTAGRAYWGKLLADEPPLLDLPYDFHRPLTRNQAAGELSIELPAEVTAQVARLARDHEATPFALFGAAYSLFLSAMTGSADVIWGFPTAGRPHPELERTVGMFVNTLVFRTRLEPSATFAEVLRAAAAQLRESLRHEDTPFEEMVGELRAPAPGRNPLFDTMLSYEGQMPDEYRCGDATLREQSLAHRFARTDLTVVIRERSSGGLWLRFEYSADLMKRATAERLASAFTDLLARVLADPTVAVAALGATTDGERARLADGTAATAHALPDVGSVHELFARHVAERPDAIAVELGDTALSYREVDARANQLAHALREYGVVPGVNDQLVAVLLDPCVEMLIAVLGVMKAGAAFVPIDPDYPHARKLHMLRDSGARVLLSRGKLADELRDAGAAVVDVSAPSRAPTTPIGIPIERDDLAYVIYTSGSTGTPKGTLIEHGALLNFACWYADYFGIRPDDGVSKFAGFGFDASIAELVPAFISGARLVIVPADVRVSIEALDDYYARHRVAVAFLPTQFGEQFLREATRHALRAAFLGGEKLRTRPTERCTIVNGYGPTEYTVATTAFTVDAPYDNIPIGKPIWNTQVLVLDRLGRPCPVGVPGELCVAGAGIARGYLNRPDLTADKFVDHPFRTGERMYRTGDLARWLDDGNLEFLGRIDTQVKVRGFRIELGEIEAALLALPGIDAAVVVAVENPQVAGDLSLVAYVVASGTTQAATEGTLKHALGQSLPVYMIPSRIVRIDELPLTANGKVDRRRLPAVDVVAEPVVEPRDARERELRALYADILGRPAEAISVETSFLALGGHSLKAAALLSAIYKRTGVQLKLSEFLEHSTVAEVARLLGERAGATADDRWEPAPPGPLALTASQTRIFAVQQLSTWSTAYNIPFAWELAPGVDLDRLARALDQLVARHHALRAELYVDDGTPRQRFRDDIHLDVERLDIADTNLHVTLDAFVRPFDLARAPLVRAAFVHTETRVVLALDVHHIVLDGLSVKLLLDDLEALYALPAGKSLALPSPTFADYVHWETGPAGRAQRDAERAWWLERFTELPSPLELPTDFDRPPRMTFEGDEVSFDLPNETSAPLLELASSNAITPLGVFLAGWAIVLSRLGNTPDVVIGVPASGRQLRGMDAMIGMFVNTVPVRVRLGADETFAQLCARLGREATDAFDHQAYQLNDLVADLGLARDASRNPLFDVLFAWNGAEFEETDAGRSRLGLTELPPAHVESKFDLELTVQAGARGLHVAMIFATKLFRRSTAERFLGNVRSVLEQAARAPQSRVRDFVMLQAWEREILLEDLNRTAAPLPDVTLVDLFLDQVRARPGAICVEDAVSAYTFAEVDRRSALLAAELIARGVGADDVVALAMARSRELLVAVLGVMRAGAGYLPIDPDVPPERAATIVGDARARLLVSDTGDLGLPDVLRWADIDWWRESAPVPSRASARGIAYVIYTSGSTGKPKGVVIEHRGAVNFVTSWRDRLGVDADDRVLLFSSYTFDASVEQMGVALAAGATLVVVTKDTLLDHDAFEAFVRAHRVSHLHAVPLFLSGFTPKQPLALRRVVVAGDICPVPVAERWSAHQPLYNAYGPTETTVISLVRHIQRHDLARPRIPVGSAVANTHIYILDWTGNLAPRGVPGEMYIGGAGVARGYLNNEALTGERFHASPFVAGDRLYKTGDIARWLPDGTIDFLGRADNQIKIRGFRVELGEIEAALLRHPAVAEAAVIVLPSGDDKRLAGYVVLRAEAQPSALRSFLARTLPSYMVPDAIVVMDALPVTTSGKIDRKRLPEPAFDAASEDDAPQTLAEERLIEIWAEVLKLPAHQIPVARSFFELGGHSLLIMVLIARVQQTFSVRLAAADVFVQPTVRGLAALIEERERSAVVPIPKAPERTSYPLTSTQRRMFAIHQATPANVSYNMPAVFRVEGQVTPERLEEVVRALIARHASLRTSFHVEHGEPVANIHDSAPFSLKIVQSDEPTDALVDRLVQPFDLAVAPLFRVWVVRRSTGAELVVLDMHHIIADGMSMSVLFREVVDFLHGRALPPVRLHMGDFAVWQATPAYQAELAEQRAFWLEQYATLPAPLQLPYDFRAPAVRSHAGDLVIAELGRDDHAALAALAHAHGSTPFATLLACWFVFLSRIGGSDDVVVGVPVGGRVHPDVQELVGMFVNTVPWRTRVPDTGTFTDFLAATRETSLRVLASEEYELEALIEQLGVHAVPGKNPLFDVMFSFQAKSHDVIDAVRVKLHPEEFVHRTAKLDLTLIASESEDGVELAFEYATELFARTTVERLAHHFVTLVRDVLAAPDKPIAELELLDAADRVQLLDTFNATDHELPPVAGVHELFAQWAARTPDARCVVYRDLTWSYRDVDRRANAIAAWLGERGIGRGDIVPILTDPCAESLPAILGVLKAGAAFLPIDASYPAGRKQTIVDDCRARAVLGRPDLADGLALTAPLLDIARAGARDDVRAIPVTRGDAAYVIYTSGSTGKPKGVVIEHGSLLNLTQWFSAYYGVQPSDVFSKYSGPSFDASISEIFPACASGCALVVVPSELRLQMTELSAYFEATGVTIAFLPTQFGEQFLRTMTAPTLRAIGLGGEKLRYYRPTPWRIVNAYGPTEYTVYTTAFTVDRIYDNIPVGKPIWNTQVYVLDKHDRPCPIGVTGELCVSGLGIARGYLNRPELTAERFVDHPWRPGTRMYRIGDLARWLPDGNIECLGRIDTQVKLRGFRIELGEIEQALLAIPGISGATAIDVVEQGVVVDLAAYYVGDVDEQAIRTALARDLPDYMVPARLCRLAALPLTPNGKVDRRALPAIEREATSIVAPEGETERVLVACVASVLARDPARVSATASFFELGGHSLKAIALVGEIYRQLGVELKVSDVFRHPSVRALARRLADTGGTTVLAAIPSAPRADSYAASSVQTRMFLLQQMEPGSTAYNVPSLFAVAAGVTREHVARALVQLAARHDAFRCAFFLDGTQVRMRVADAAELPLVDARAVDDLVQPFDLGTAPVARAAWIAGERGNQLFFDMHHIATDGASMAMFVDELERVLAGETLPEPPRGLVACTAWETGDQATAVIAKQREFWRATFADGVPALGLVTDFTRPPIVDPAGDVVTHELPAELSHALRELARARGLSLHALMLAAFDVLLARLARQPDIAVATAASGRWHPDMHGVFGMFVNTLVLANHVDPKRAFGELAAEVAARSIEALDHQAFPFADLVDLVGDARHAGHTPLVDVMFSMQNAEERATGGGALTPVDVAHRTAKFDLTLTVDEATDAITLAFEYRTSLFRRATIERHARCLAHLLADIVAHPDAAVEQLSILTDDDRRLVEVEWNHTEREFPRDGSLVRAFERTAARLPDKRALVDGNRSYTYAEIDAAANRLAHRVRALGVDREGVVAILTEPSAELVIAELAAMKAGGAFLPLDHRYPPDRLEYMLVDSAARVLIAAPGLDRELDWAGPRLVLEPALFAGAEPATPPVIDPRPSDLAYVIYTSGSTGRPKGVMIEQHSLVAYVHRVIATYELTEADRTSKYAGIAFDASIDETFPPLCCGAELHIVPDDIRLSPPGLVDWFDRQHITWAFLPPALGEELQAQPRHPRHLRWLMVGGDRLRRFADTPYRLSNEYGPTETTVCATAFFVDRAYDNIPIGKPIANTKVFVLDPAGELCPPGVPGELCIAGSGLARGYLGAPELTAAKFAPHPVAGGRLYRTGDLARWLDDGNLEFLGRIDTQVKIRGFRIELGEIEQAMLEVAGVTACVVVDRADPTGDKYLAAYWSGSAELAAIRDHLAARMPDYMVPAAFVHLDAIPVTTSGKVDRRRLPEPHLAREPRVVVPAATPGETLVVAAFTRALGRSDVGATDDFFELGGNSLKAVAVVAALASDFRISANDLFRLRTARAIARDIPLARGDLQDRLVALASELRGSDADPDDDAALAPDLARYRARYQPYSKLSVHRQMAYRDILLTGATGFLGSYLLRDLLERTDAKLHVTVRAKHRQDAWDRLVAKTTRYFGEDLLARHARRIHLVPGDLSEPTFGLDRGTFDALARTVDCVVHAAALTKHYGESAAFARANVDATRHVCELARRAGCDLSLISTISVGMGAIAGKDRALFTEFDCDIGQVADNHYVRTKLEAEKLVHALRDDGLACNIFRVGFLAGDSKTLGFQDNAGDSGFVQTLKSYLALGRIPRGALAQSFCPVDEVSAAVVRLLATSSLLDQTHHVERVVDLATAEALVAADARVEAMDEAAFYDWLAAHVGDADVGPAATAMLLHGGLLDERVATQTVTLREKTDALLARVGFTWGELRPEQVWSLAGN